ncbi:MAG: SDR family oxidoreductase [Bacillota bacterium]
MDREELCVVTGAFGYTGKYITRRLISSGKRVLTLTGHPGRDNTFGDRVSIAPFCFDNPDRLAESMRGATTFFNTYWVRFPYGGVTYGTAVENTRILIDSAARAGVRRIVHVSITNAFEESPLPYFKGKGILEREIVNSGLSYSIIRPTVIFGPEDILINNIAWLLRRFPVFVVPGTGEYRLQPVFVEDMAEIAVNASERQDNCIIDAVGPEIYTFNQLLNLIAEKVKSRARIVHLRPGLALFLSGLVGLMVKDVVLTGDEVRGLMAGLLVSREQATGKTMLSDWLDKNRHTVGSVYASELKRHYR